MADTALLTSLITMALLLLVSAGLLGRDLFRGEQRLRHRHGGGVLLLAMVLSVGLYMTNGRLGMGDLPLSSRLDELAATQKKIDSAAMEKQHALARAKEMAEADPDNIETLFHLADAAAAAGDSDTEIQTLRSILERTGNPLVKSMIGEALTREAGGIVTTKAMIWIDEALMEAPEDWRGRYLKGLYLSQSGDDTAALALWSGLAADLEGTELYPAVVSVIRDAAGRIGVNAENYLPAPPPGPGQIAEMITGLENRLTEDGTTTDTEGWIMLIRSLIVFGDQDRRDRALLMFLNNMTGTAEDAALLIRFAELLLPPEELPEVMPAILVPMLARAREITPDDPGVLFFSGLHARGLGNREDLRMFWGKLQAKLDKDNPLYALLEAELSRP